MLKVGIIFIVFMAAAILIALFLVYYFLYRSYLNRRLNGQGNKKWFPHPLTVVCSFVLILSIFVNVILSVEMNRLSKQNNFMENELINLNNSQCIIEFEDDSPYLYYRDLVISGDSAAYQISKRTSDGFEFYFAECGYEYADSSSYYPEYICYIKYSEELSDNYDMTIKYVYDENSSFESTGEPIDEIMFLSKTLEQLPKEVIFTIRKRGNDKLEEGKLVAEASFEIYSVD